MRRPLIGGKDFKTSIGQGEQVQGGVMGGLPKGILCVFWEEKDEDECVRKKNSSYVWKKMLFMEKKCVQTKSMEGSCV